MLIRCNKSLLSESLTTSCPETFTENSSAFAFSSRSVSVKIYNQQLAKWENEMVSFLLIYGVAENNWTGSVC